MVKLFPTDPNSDDAKKKEQARLKIIFSYAMHALHKFLIQTQNIDIAKTEIEIPIQPPEIILESNNKKYKLYLDVVSKDYELDFNIIDSYTPDGEIRDELIKHCTFLINSVKTSFDIVKGILKDKKTGYYPLHHLNVNLDVNTTIFFEIDDSVRVGIIIKEITN